MNKILSITLASLMLLGNASATYITAKDVAIVSAKKDKKKKVVNTNPFLPEKFHVEVTFIHPLKYQPHSVNGFSMDFAGDSVSMCLPYIGELYTAPMSDSGLNFTSDAENMKRTVNKKGDEVLTFKTRKEGNVYEFTVTAYDNNNIDIFLQPSNGQSCSYTGTWSPAEEKK